MTWEQKSNGQREGACACVPNRFKIKTRKHTQNKHKQKLEHTQMNNRKLMKNQIRMTSNQIKLNHTITNINTNTNKPSKVADPRTSSVTYNTNHKHEPNELEAYDILSSSVERKQQTNKPQTSERAQQSK